MADLANSPTAAEALLNRRLQAVMAPTPPPSLQPELDADVSGDTVDFDPASPWNADDALRREMDRLQASREFADAESHLSGFRHSPDPFKPSAYCDLDPLAGAESRSGRNLNSNPLSGVFGDPAFSGRGFAATTGTNDEITRLRTENEELNKLIDEMKQIFAHAAKQEVEQSAALVTANAKLAERELLLQDHVERIELLTQQIHELEQHIQEGVAAPPPPPSEDELTKMADELEQERCQLTRERKTLDEERNQLREDEEDMMRQMREMEVQMAKERADLARQRTEVERLHSEVKRELEQRGDRALTDRLAQFHRRHHEVLNRGSQSGTVPAPTPIAPQPELAANGQPKEAGLFGRFFGRK